MVGLHDQCRFGDSRATPSIDTPLHALLPVDHIDHVHPDAVIALATTGDGRHLTPAATETTSAGSTGCGPDSRSGCARAASGRAPGRARRRTRWSRLDLLGTDERGVRSHDGRPHRARGAFLAQHSRGEPFGTVVPSPGTAAVRHDARRSLGP